MVFQMEGQQYTQLTRPPSPSDTDLSDLPILEKADFGLTPSADKNIPTSTTLEYEWPQSTGYPPIWAQVCGMYSFAHFSDEP
jgi:hypothetical protein